MSILERLEGWSIKIFAKKLLARAVPIGAAWLAMKLKFVSPDSFAGLDPEQVKLTFTAAFWAGFTLLGNVLKFSLNERQVS